MRGITRTPEQICMIDVPIRRANVALKVRMTSVEFGYPIAQNQAQITPRECRERQVTYSAPVTMTFTCMFDGEVEVIRMGIGLLPIMVLSRRSSTLAPPIQ